MPERPVMAPSSTSSRPIQVIAISSGKGGVGKTNIAVNLAIAMGSQGRHPLLLDADLGLANIDVLLGLQPRFSLADVMAGHCSIEDTLIEAPRGVMVVPASSGIKRMTELSPIEHAGMISAFNGLSGRFDSLLIDTGAGIGDSVVVHARAAQEVIVVVCDEPTSIADAYALIKVLHRDYSVERFRILVNRSKSAEHGRNLFEQLLRIINRFLNLTPDYMGTIPEDSYLQKSVRRQQAVIEAYPLSKSAVAFEKLASQLNLWPRADTASGHLEFFVESLTQQSHSHSSSSRGTPTGSAHPLPTPANPSLATLPPNGRP